jgi:hypothetical protein
MLTNSFQVLNYLESNTLLPKIVLCARRNKRCFYLSAHILSHRVQMRVSLNNYDMDTGLCRTAYCPSHQYNQVHCFFLD